jgi:hypothetical protein
MSAVFRQIRTRPYALAALAALTAALVVLGAGLAPGIRLGAWGLAWQVVTGGALLGAVAWQWMLLIARMTGPAETVLRHYARHRLVGAATAALFAAHAVRFGYGWTSALSLTFLLLAASGLLNREIMRYRAKWTYNLWLFLHVALSAALLPLALVHVWVALAYE